MAQAVAETPLGRLMAADGRKQGAVAAAMGIGRSRLRRLMAGQQVMTVEEAKTAARVFRVPLATFLEEAS